MYSYVNQYSSNINNSRLTILTNEWKQLNRITRIVPTKGIGNMPPARAKYPQSLRVVQVLAINIHDQTDV